MLADTLPKKYKCHISLDVKEGDKRVNKIKITDYDDLVIYDGIGNFIINDGYSVTFKDDTNKVHNYLLRHFMTF